jgi:hypothetical protein
MRREPSRWSRPNAEHMSKDKKQALTLGALLAVLLGVGGYMFRDSIIPRSSGGVPPAPLRMTVPNVSDSDPFFERQDYRDLRPTVGVPVQAIKVDSKSNNPFVTPN